MYQYVFFDLDGTLTDSQEGVLECVRYAIEAMGRPLPEGQDLLKFIGPPLQDSFMRYCGFSCEEAQEALRLFREQYVPVGQFKNRPAPGVAEMLGRLKARGVTLALASSKAESQCVSICERFGFAPHLAVIAGSSDSRDQSKADVIREAMGRLGLTGPEVIEQEMGKDEFDSADRSLVYRTTGGKHKYIMRDANYLVEDTLGDFHDQLAAIMEAPYDEIVKGRRIGSEEPVDEQLALAELSVEMAPKDARDVWAYFGNEDVEQIPEMTTAEFLAVAQRR